ncbi:MAG: AfsR/SARP family transcriptional regulator, partial [Chloroflexi bacterium]|nr:AfsR/SARP family transcriptional regulator [Chloroflexota bacterium]
MPQATASSIPDWPEGHPDDTLSIWLLGDFRVSVGSHQIESGRWRLRKAATLVKLLALSETHRLHREQVLDLLWPDLEPPAAANNLHHALHRARRVLSPTDATSPHLRIQGEQVVLCPSGSLWVDVETFEAAASAARREGDASAYRAALALYTGDLLPADLYEDWAAERRASLRSLHLALLLELAGLYEGMGAPGPAIETLQRAIAAEPACEEAHAGLMRLYAQAGQRHQALRQYDQLRQALRQELDNDPDAATQQLHADILAGRIPLAPALPGDGTGQRAAPGRRRHNLPAALTSFVGREAEIAEIKRLLGATRLLTITGTGGSGKTRLALEAAGELVESYPDGVWLVELAPLSDGNLVERAVAGALEVPERQDRPTFDALVEALRPRRLLLVLDNCEHLVDACARLSQELLSGCPELQILATSREALGVLGEVTGIVPPLALPDRAQFRAVDELLGCAAVRLFVERAQARQPSFVLTPDDARSVVAICKQVDGIPLAIELAAARVGLLSVEQIAARLENVLGLLTTGSRTAQPRQQTLRSTLDWSYDLLSEPERTLFRRVYVFAGGWTLEAAELLGVAPGMGELDVLDLLSHLVDKSLVAAE